MREGEEREKKAVEGELELMREAGREGLKGAGREGLRGAGGEGSS